MLQNAGVLYILTCTCASRHSGVQFFDIWSSKSGPYPSVFSHFHLQMCLSPQPRAMFEHRNIGTSKMAPRLWCFVHFDLKMCFAPQPRAIFQHRNFKNGSTIVVLCAFWLENVLRATAACHFSTSELQKWLRQWGVLCILTCKCASRHSGVPFFTSLPEQLPPHPPL